jgi:putative ABC transport system substrate-binding protein
MTVRSRCKRTVQQCTFWVLLVSLMTLSGQAVSAQVAVVMSDGSADYQDVYRVLQTSLVDTAHGIGRVRSDSLTTASLGEAHLIITVGVEAAEALAMLPNPNRSPVLAVVVPREWYLKGGRARLSDGGRRDVSAIYIDQPYARQARLIRLAFPRARRVGVLLSAEQSELIGELIESFRLQHLRVVHATLAGNERLVTPLEQVLSESDVLLALPDPLIFNRDTAQSIFLTSYRYRVPVLGYSNSMTRAGALLSLYSSPAQIGRQTAEWVRLALSSQPVRLPPPAHPAYIEISINDQVARTIGLSLPSRNALKKRVEAEL